jgi:pimeloyl-ACP methyl ester carboxylesterase
MIMSTPSSSPTRRDLLVLSAAAGAASLIPASVGAATGGDAIRPFSINVPEEALVDLRRRLAATRWPERETLADASQGVQLATIQELARYWRTEYDWRKVEAKLNALPQFMTEIDGLDIHFIHVRSKHENALPLIVTHGWPGSPIEQLKIVDPLTNPTAHGASASDAFHVVIPSLPGYGFSGKPTTTGWDPIRIARAWIVLMKRLGYTQFVAQGGDWGNAVTEQMALQAPPELLGIHTNMPATIPDEIAKALASGGPPPAGLSADEKRAWDQLSYFYKHGLGYAQEMMNRPQTLYAICGFTVGLAAWMIEHDIASYKLISRVFDGQREGLTRDDILDNATLYWFTNTAVSSARLYWENKFALFRPEERADPHGHHRLSGRDLCSPSELDRAGVSQTHPLQQARQRRPLCGLGTAGALFRRGSRGLQTTAEIVAGSPDSGLLVMTPVLYVAWEQPELFGAGLRAGFRSLRQSI